MVVISRWKKGQGLACEVLIGSKHHTVPPNNPPHPQWKNEKQYFIHSFTLLDGAAILGDEVQICDDQTINTNGGCMWCHAQIFKTVSYDQRHTLYTFSVCSFSYLDIQKDLLFFQADLLLNLTLTFIFWHIFTELQLRYFALFKNIFHAPEDHLVLIQLFSSFNDSV